MFFETGRGRCYGDQGGAANGKIFRGSLSSRFITPITMTTRRNCYVIMSAVQKIPLSAFGGVSKHVEHTARKANFV